MNRNHLSLYKCIIVPLLLFNLFPLEGQENFQWTTISRGVKFQRISTDQGLSQSSVLCMLQDKKGFMWFGTEDGLNRYDGYNFKIYRPDVKSPYSISSNRIFDLYEDRDGNIWAGTNGGGLCKFDRRLERFTRYQSELSNPESISSDTVSCIIEDDSGTLWVGTMGGGINCVIRPSKKNDPVRFVSYMHDPKDPNSLSNDTVMEIYKDRNGELWIGTEGGGLDKMIPGLRKDDPPQFVHFFDETRKQGQEQDKTGNNNGAGVKNVYAICEDQHNMLWIGTDEGLFRFDPGEIRWTEFLSPQNQSGKVNRDFIRRIYKDKTGVVWIGTDGSGLIKLIPGKTKNSAPFIYRYKYTPFDIDGIASNAVESLLEDRSGILWIGLYRAGLDKLLLRGTQPHNREAEQFIYLKHNPRDPQKSLSFDAVNDIIMDKKGALWVGSDGGGVDEIIPGPNKDEPLRYFHYKNNPSNPKSLNNDNVTCLLEDSKGSIWVGTFRGGLNILNRDKDPKTTSFIHYTHDENNPDSLSHNFIQTIVEDREGAIWIGTVGGGLNRFDRKTGTFTHYKNKPDNPESLSLDYVTGILEDHSGTLWIGTSYGLNRFNPGRKNFTQYYKNPHKPNSLSNNLISILFQDKSGTTWIGTDGGGLNKLIPDPAGSHPSFRHYTQKDGLPNSVISNILEDESGNLWISSNYGLSKFTPSTGEIKNYDMRDGIISNEFNMGAALRNKFGELFFGSNSGINIFHPDYLKINSFAPQVVITDFKIFNQTVPVGPWKKGQTILENTISETNHISLSYLYEIFSFEFAALDFTSPGKNGYAYIMEGLEKNWNFVKDRRFVTYTTLPPGKYIFRVRGSNNDGTWNKMGTAVEIEIIPPFWKTSLFLSMSALFVLVAVVVFYILRTRRIKTRNIQLESTNILLNNEIGERQKIEEALRNSERNYRNVVDRSPIGIFKTTIDGWVIFANDALLNMSGFKSAGDMRQVNMMSRYNNPKERELVLEYLKKEGKVESIELTVLSKEGVKKNVLLTATLEDNVITGMVVDVTERKKAVNDLMESETKYKTLFNSIPDPIMIFHGDSDVFLDCNKAALDRYGYSSEELRDMTLSDLKAAEDADNDTALCTHITKKGERLQVEIHTAFLEYQGQSAYINIIRDVTQQKQLEERLYQVQKMESIGRLAGGIAHDFNNLLTVVVGHAELALLKIPENDDNLRKDLQTIFTTGNKAGKLTAQLLAFSRKQIIQPKIIDINYVISNLDKMLQRIIGEDIIIEHVLNPNIHPIKADPVQLEQILVNLIVNARDAINDQPLKNSERKITIRTDQLYLDESFQRKYPEVKLGLYISLSVGDTGVGMSEDVKSKIFEPFFTTKEVGKGTGLGLSTVYGIVKQNLGFIYVYSEPGMGTTFKIYWPAAWEKESDDTAELKRYKMQGGSENILFVEDDQSVRDFSTAALKAFGYKVCEACNGKEAMEIVRSGVFQFDLLVTDVVMPEMNGKDLADQFGQFYPSAGILLTSGYTDSRLIPNLELSDNFLFLPKPYSIENLLLKVREAINQLIPQ